MKSSFQNIAIQNITTSGLNDRKVFDTTAQQELAESIKEHGILQNLIVRKNGKPGNYELVAGERRLIAAKMAGLESVPCNIKDLDDTGFKQLMLIENLQRQEIHPIDEAMGIQRLLDGGMDIGNVALKIGKTETYIRKRAALNNLSETAMELFREGKMQLGHAQVLCFFTHGQQDKAIENVIQKERGFAYFDHPTSLRNWMDRFILRALSEAVFDTGDAGLVKKAGACISCSKQTGYNKELFSDLTPEAKCIDPDCFLKKSKVSIERHNRKMLKQFNMKKADCPTVSKDWYTYDGSLGKNDWHLAENADECPNVTVGFLKEHDLPAMARLVCTNPRCKVHFEQPEKVRESEIPENETKSESYERKMNKRRLKNKIEDTHASRKEFMERAALAGPDRLVSFELEHLILIMINRSNGNALELAEKVGFKKDGGKHSFYWISDFMDYIAEQENHVKVSFLRTLVLRENLNPDCKTIHEKNPYSEGLIIHGKELGIEYEPILKEREDARIETYELEDAELAAIIEKEKEKQQKVADLIKKCKSGYPELHKVIKSADRREALSKMKLEELSKMAFRLGLKRKKDGDVDYYVGTITEGLESLIVNWQ